MDPSPFSPTPNNPRGSAARPAAGKPGAARFLPRKALFGRRAGAAAASGAVKPVDAESGKSLTGQPALVSLSWADQDIENRWGLFKGGRFTSVNKTASFFLALLCSTVFLVIMAFFYHSSFPLLSVLGRAFVRPGNLFATGPATLCFCWGCVIVSLKIPKLKLQRRALELAAVPQHHDFVLNEATARTVLERMRSLVDGTQYFILLNRIDRALSNLHNIGGVSDVSTILKSQAENDENQIASSYALVNAMIWAIPVLGFVGTVLGLSIAISQFTEALSGSQEFSVLKTGLQKVTAGLSTAFETTLVGLVFALMLHLFSDLVQERETDFLDECNDYCHANVVSKLRVQPKGENS